LEEADQSSSCAEVIIDGFVQNDLHRTSTIDHEPSCEVASLSCFPETFLHFVKLSNLRVTCRYTLSAGLPYGLFTHPDLLGYSSRYSGCRHSAESADTRGFTHAVCLQDQSTYFLARIVSRGGVRKVTGGDRIAMINA
jgi:hypothetical protein